MINNKRVCEIQAKTVRLHRRKNQAVATPRYWQMKISSGRAEVQAAVEFVHINATFHRIDDSCKDTKHDSSHVCCTGCQNRFESQCRMMSYFLKHIPLEHQLLFL